MSENTPELLPEVSRFVKKVERVEKNPLPDIKEVSPDYLRIADKIAEISGGWNPVEIFGADNEADQKAEFLEAFKDKENKKEYNPVFDYKVAQEMDLAGKREELAGLLGDLRKLRPGFSDIDRKARAALYYKIKDDLATCDLIEGLQNKPPSKTDPGETEEEKIERIRRNEGLISRALHSKYRGYSDSLGQEAGEIYRGMLVKDEGGQEKAKGILSEEEQSWLREKQFTPPEIKAAFEWAMERLGIPHGSGTSGYRVILDKKATSIDVRDKSASGLMIVIPDPDKKDKDVSGERLLELIAHEICGHARQSLNGQRLFVLGGGPLKFDDETLYEGLAMRLERDFRQKYLGETEASPLPFYAFGIQAAENGASFYQVFSQIYEKSKAVPAERLPILHGKDVNTEEEILKHVWKVTYRIFRGHLDTSNVNRFANPKDLVYLNGWLIDKQLVEQGYGHINEAAVFASGGLQYVADYNLEEGDLPYKFMDVAGQYWTEVLKPQMTRS